MIKTITVLILSLFASSANAAVLNGSITLPQGQVAPSGSSQFVISTQPSLGVQQTVTIPQFQSSVPFSLNLPNGASYRVRFACISGCSGLDITTTGFWRDAPAGVVGLEADATSYLSAQTQLVNILLESADTFAGEIRLPEGFQADGSETLVATVSAAAFGQVAMFTQTVNVEEGQSRWPFVIGVPPSSTGGGWNLNVQCQNCNVDIASQEHYPTTATGDPASLELGSQFFFLKNRDSVGMELTLISIAMPEPDKLTTIAPILLLLDE